MAFVAIGMSEVSSGIIDPKMKPGCHVEKGQELGYSIDGGEPQSTKWGDTSHEVDPGEHTVHVEVLYALNKKVGKASTTVSVAADEAVNLKYRPPALVFMQGKLKRKG